MSFEQQSEPAFHHQTGIKALPASFRDPSGFIFRQDGRLYRQVNQSYQTDYDYLLSSGLYQQLTEAGLLVSHEEVSLDLAQSAGAYRVIQPEEIPFISYPYEWCFSQLKAATLTTLTIQQRALKQNMTLKDASAYNIQFHHGKPIFIDSLSFETYVEGRPWTPYRQFCQHFLAPLALMSYRDVRLSQLLRVYLDGVPLDLAARLLPRRSYLKLGLLLHLHLHARGQQRFDSSKTEQPNTSARQLTRQALVNLVDNLIETVNSLTWQPAGSDWNWTDYYQGDSYSAAGFDDKKRIVQDFIQRVQPGITWDVGANTGVFSRLASQSNSFTVAWDVDPGAVELNYRRVVEQAETGLLPLVLDLTNPSPGLGWANQERDSFATRGKPDLVMTLALIHHLAISNNVPFEHIARLFAQLGQWLIIEFVPKSDKKVQQLLASRQDIFTQYTQSDFETVFGRTFDILDIQPIVDSQRVMYLMKARPHA